MDSFCCRCGARLSPGARFCHRCGHPYRPPERAGSNAAGKSMDWKRTAEKGLALLRRYWLAAALAVVIVFGAGVLLWQNTARCAVSGCAGRAEYGRYCSAHVCLSAGCTNCRTNGKYCAIHRGVDPASLPAQIEISNVRITERGSYTVATGTVTNVGVYTYEFVKLKGTFRDSSDTVLDTDWTYAVGAEGLAPGESATFRLSVPEDYRIRECSVSIIDCDTVL